MNKQRMLEIADAIEDEGRVNKWHIKFDMNSIASKAIVKNAAGEEMCGTACCLAGTALVMWMPGISEDIKSGRLDSGWMDSLRANLKVAGDLLGLTYIEYQNLFMCARVEQDDDDEDMATELRVSFADINANRELVPAAIRWMVENDCVDWDDAAEAVGFNEDLD